MPGTWLAARASTTRCRPSSWTWGIEWATPIMPMLTGSGAFGQVLDVPDDADAQTRLLAMVGRRR